MFLNLALRDKAAVTYGRQTAADTLKTGILPDSASQHRFHPSCNLNLRVVSVQD